MTATPRVFDYLNPDVPVGLRVLDVPLIDASAATLKGYGEIVRDPRRHRIEIVKWPLRGWRTLDAGTGDEGGTTEGVFACHWQGNRLYGRNEAVDGHYVIGFRQPPGSDAAGVLDAAPDDASPGHAVPSRVLLWHANYHPDGGQLFWPLDGQPFVVPVAPPGDDIRPEQFVAFRSDGSFGIYIHPDIWHEGTFPIAPAGRFFDKQGKVHARVSVDLAAEFGVLLSVPLTPP
ncbi:MAG: ureidoglycolate lyase [Alphaproteobacteria bacterium]|nr:ureidoglycolate lyase [Alphaproteobacteria bacterium]